MKTVKNHPMRQSKSANLPAKGGMKQGMAHSIGRNKPKTLSKPGKQTTAKRGS